MSDREKKLVLFFGLAAFVLVNFFGFSLYQQQKLKLARALATAQGELKVADETAAQYESVIDEKDWLDGKMPEPRSGVIVATELEQYASNQASTHQLTVKRRAIKKNDETGAHFHRAAVEFNVTGREDSLYRWLDRLQMPDQFRAITSLRLSPDAKDDTLIDCTVVAEQWYIPHVEDDTAAPVEETAPATDAAGNPTPTPTPAPEEAPPAEEAPPESINLTPDETEPPGTE